MKMSRTVRKYRWFFAGITFSVVILMVIVGLFSLDDETNNMIVEYIEGLGWKLDPTPREISDLTIPEEFDVVYDTYNAVQKRAGFPFSFPKTRVSPCRLRRWRFAIPFFGAKLVKWR